MRITSAGWLAWSLLFAAGCGDDEQEAFTLTSPAFADGAPLPAEYTCSGKNFPNSGQPPTPHTLPELNWTPGPEGTQSYAVVFKDVTLTGATPINELGYHWAIWNIPVSVTTLPKGLPSGATTSGIPGATQFSGPLFGDGYVGPCPSWSIAPGGGNMPPTASNDSYTFTVFSFSTPTVTVPAPPAAGTMGDSGMNLSYVHVLDDFFIANTSGNAVLRTTSDASPAMFVPPG